MPIVIPTPWHLFNDTITVSNNVWSQENTGAPEATSMSEPVNVPGFVQPISAADNLQYGRTEQNKLVRIFLGPLDENGTAYTLATGSEVTINSEAQYRIVEVESDLCNIGCVFRAVAERVS